MAVERTLSIIKPDAVANQYIGEIYSRFVANDLRIIAAKMAHLTKKQAEEFYAIHKDRPFYSMLVEFMISGPVMITVLEGEDAVARYRTLMGATMPEFAAPGSIRYDLARDGRANENAVHGSDAAETAAEEIKFFFKPEEICKRTR
jgi:nucleoside-diphosphate kinase